MNREVSMALLNVEPIFELVRECPEFKELSRRYGLAAAIHPQRAGDAVPPWSYSAASVRSILAESVSTKSAG